MDIIDKYVVFAAKYGVLPSEAHVLPALFEQAAQATGSTPERLLTEATYSNILLGMYLAECAADIAVEVPQTTGKGKTND